MADAIRRHLYADVTARIPARASGRGMTLDRATLGLARYKALALVRTTLYATRRRS